ncbi:RING-H2 finger protein ATL47-like [Asparagus officinalis]|uniref:RING-H2 finger protein ATL47-like n=1 Tax=Asparagus officinalis TaxID=4686 RepID=UPI00098E3AC8|nr:RING-H2 finger protein ATL47-like [Asparagus officinalis]
MFSSLLPSWGSSLIYLFLTVCTIFVILQCYKLIQKQFFPSVSHRNNQMQLPIDNSLGETPWHIHSVGLASAVIHSLPVIQFKEEIKKAKDQETEDCVVCLGEFKENEWLRLLPNCAHVFHVSCIDTWFRDHSTCPLCRMGVLYDISTCSSSLSPVALLASLRREDPGQERMTGHRLSEDLHEGSQNYKGESSMGDRNVQTIDAPESHTLSNENS